MKERDISGDLFRENRELRRTLERLLEELEGTGDPDLARVREEMPAPPGERNPIVPPNERKDGS